MVNRQYGTTWVFSPVPCFTGARHAQPRDHAVRLEACTSFTPRYEVYFEQFGALDAPEVLPSGSLKGMDFQGNEGLSRLVIGYVQREGAR